MAIVINVLSLRHHRPRGHRYKENGYGRWMLDVVIAIINYRQQDCRLYVQTVGQEWSEARWQERIKKLTSHTIPKP